MMSEMEAGTSMRVWRVSEPFSSTPSRKEMAAPAAAAALMADVRDSRRLLELLARHRAALLDEVHKSEKKIDCLDYLIYRIKQNQHKREE